MACWTGRHRMVQQPGMVRRLLSAHRYRSHRSHHGFLLWSRLHRRSTDGRDFLCCESSTEPKPLQCRIDLLCTLHSRQRFRRSREPPPLARELRGVHHPSAQTKLAQALVQASEAMGGLHPPDRRECLRQALQHSSTPLVCGGSGPMSFRDCEHVWRRGWLCTISASGSMSSSVVPGWPSLTCSDGDLITHTRRLSELPSSTKASSLSPGWR